MASFFPIGFLTIIILFVFGVFRQEEISLCETFSQIFRAVFSKKKKSMKKICKILAIRLGKVYNSQLAHPCTA